MISQADKDFLEATRWAVESYQQPAPPRKLPMRDKERLLDLVHTYVIANYHPDLWCQACEAQFILNAFLMLDDYETREQKILERQQRSLARDSAG